MGPWVKVHWLLHEDSERAGTLQPHQTQEPGGSEEAVPGSDAGELPEPALSG